MLHKSASTIMICLLFLSFIPITTAGYVDVVREFYIQIDIQHSSPQLVVVMGNHGPTDVTLSEITINNINVLNTPKSLLSNENTTITIPTISQALGNSDNVIVGYKFAHSTIGSGGPTFGYRFSNFNGTLHNARIDDVAVPIEVPAPDVPNWLREGVYANYSKTIQNSSGTFTGSIFVEVDSFNPSDDNIVLLWRDTARGVNMIGERPSHNPSFSDGLLYYTPAQVYSYLHPTKEIDMRGLTVSTETVTLANSVFEAVIIQAGTFNVWFSNPDGLMLKATFESNGERIKTELLSTNIRMSDNNGLESTISDEQDVDFFDPIFLSGIAIAVVSLIIVTVFLRYKK